MNRQLMMYEFRKIIEQPLIMVFVLLCLLLNSLYVMFNDLDQEYLNYVSAVHEEVGGQVTTDFTKKLSDLPRNKQLKRLKEETSEVHNIFENYSAKALGEEMIEVFQINGVTANKIRGKYEKLTPVIEQLGQDKSALDLADAGDTTYLFSYMRGRIFYAILVEGIIFAVLIGLYVSTSENNTKTELTVFSSKTGRKLLLNKYVVSLLAILLFYSVVLVVTLGLCYLRYSLNTIGESSVSSFFHVNIYIPGIYGIPFITWKQMNFNQYFQLSASLGFLLVVIFHGIGYQVGVWLNHFMKGILMLLTLCILIIIVSNTSNNWWSLFSLCMWLPVEIVRHQSYWFTEMGPYATLPWQETIASLVNLLILILTGGLAARYFFRKEIK